MASLLVKAIFLVLAIATTPSTAWTRRLVNRLSHRVLFAHCEPGDDDLTPQYIKSMGEFKFSYAYGGGAYGVGIWRWIKDSGFSDSGEDTVAKPP